MTSIRRILLAGTALVALAGITAPASAATGASDTATPMYRTGTAASAANKFDCNGFSCTFVINTKTTDYPCATEIVVLASGQPALLYPNTYCQVTINGTFDFTGDETGPCVLLALQSLHVQFTSGANAAFNGGFDASGVFKPTGISTDGLRITQAQVTVKGADTLDSNPLGTGKISGASFTIRFPGAGLDKSMCYPYATGTSAGYVSSVTSNGTVVIAP
jgi:hypothetical protein